ncbi:MAG: DEAD/DEAH box helicase [Sphingobacteriales bacterium]|nr:MAG: DEAD/DEAH box helicase [Sphingobacteriales bacterium]
MDEYELDFFLKELPSTIKKKGLEVYINEKILSYIKTEYSVSTQVLKSEGEGYYDVFLEYEEDEEEIITSCTCPYHQQHLEDCKHIAATGYLWKAIINGSSLKLSKNLAVTTQSQYTLNLEAGYSQYNFIIKSLDYWVLKDLFTGKLLASSNTTHSITENKTDKSCSLVFPKNIVATATHLKNEVLALKCNCGKLTATKICSHLVILLDKISTKKGAYYFKKYNNYDIEKQAVLSKFGLKLTDEFAKKFEFGIDSWGNFKVIKQPQNLLKIADYEQWQNKLTSIKPPKPDIITLTPSKKLPADITAVGLVIVLDGKHRMPFWIDAIAVTQKKGVFSYKKIVLQNNNDLSIFSHLPDDVFAEITKLTTNNLLDNIKKNSGYDFYSYSPNTLNNLDNNCQKLIMKQFRDVLKTLAQLQHPDLHFFTTAVGQSFSNATCLPVKLNAALTQIELYLAKKNDFWVLSLNIQIENKTYTLKKASIHYSYLLQIKDTIYLLDNKDEELFNLFNQGDVMLHQQDTEAFIEKIIKPLSKIYAINFDASVNIENLQNNPAQPVIYLSELNDTFLMVRPKWKYGTYEAEMDGATKTILNNQSQVISIERDTVKEQELIDFIKTLHPRFKVQNNKEYFYLPFTEAMNKNWFMQFFNELQNKNIPVYGLNDLKKFKYNTNKPVFEMKSSSGIDWFDLQIEVHYGEQTVGLAELKKAILAKQEFILLKDGTLGVLPEEWIKKYSPLLRMGQIKDDNLKVSKLHYTLLDELYNQLDDTAIQDELNEKKQNLHRLGDVKEIDLPKKLKATLRDYQIAGYQWIHQLKKLGWGGCLADDMGLGKTLQALTFLQHCIEQSSTETHLIVCPTSLIYNWESEIQKFTPGLKYYIHYGTDRHLSDEKFTENNLIITSYGMVRSDIEHLSKLNFGYLLLDESQAIKNPAAQITKAVQVLKSANKLILSGTPVQNNTFDLYAQMNFLNPGMLGNMEFFKNEFANPIDKYGDKAKGDELRKLIYPFMLRRTKEQVAKDLPDKTETVLWCEMGTEQRKVYDYYKKLYRENLMERIAENGMGKSSMYILEGLLKLRQICDSPALLKDEKYKNDSVKIKELVRELEDNTGTHKVLVFSQFVEMLSLIRTELDQRQINYSYLDGSTPAIKRKDAVTKFQTDDTIRVFLISLKAGGVGLNLTSADYVYLIDPWWNPATEQQAIDRTHRIGQTNKVFAYKMICKDSVEEKIVQLQQKKKALASDLISEEAGFVKKLTKDDIAFLFS